MDKKMFIAALLAVFVSSVFAASFEDNVVNLIEQKTNTKVKIVKTENLKGTKDLKLIVIEIPDNLQRVPILVTKDCNTVVGLSNVFFAASNQDEEIVQNLAKELEEYNETSQKQAAGKLIEQLKPEQYITLKSSDKNSTKTLFIVADPNCGYCREEFRNIDERLKTHNVNIVLVGILGEDSQKKAATAMSKINSSMSEKAKLNGLKEVFSNNYKAAEGVDISAVKATTGLLFNKSGVIRGVPFIYEQ